MNVTKLVYGVLSTLAAGQIASAQLTIPNGTRISARLEQTITSATAEEGQQVQLSVTEAVRIDNQIVIPQGSPVLGTIVIAQEKRRMGRAGKLDFSVDKVRSADGAFIPLRYTMQKKAREGKGLSTGIMTAGAAVLFWPAAPFFLLRKGKDVNINKGMIFEVFTDQDHTVGGQVISAAPAPAPLAAAQPQIVMAAQAQPQPQFQPQAAPAVELGTVNITSDLPGAEIEVDGIFVGSTPGAAKLSPGMHRITVKHGALMWSRDLMVQPAGNVNVNALLKR
jgi:hypothetical protein